MLKELRPFQKAALVALETPGHVLCVAPTGSGKSLIYERAALKSGRRTLLVTPLVALARQQHEQLRARMHARLGAGRPSQGPPENLRPGIWITSPEKLQSPGALQALRRWRPDFLVVDECHCLWEWGESFRPAFRAIPRLLRELGIGSSLWLTATLPPEARKELRQELASLKELGSFDLPPRLELCAVRVPWPERAEALIGWISEQREPGIVFVHTRESAHRLTRLIQAAGRAAIPYHAGLGTEERQAIEARIAQGLPDVIVATSAFGMGMNYPQLQWSALWQAPPSLLSLAQAIGRAGRDPSRAARALVLWEAEDFRLLEWTLRGSERRMRQLEQVRKYLGARECRRSALKTYFDGDRVDGEAGSARCGLCDFCSR